MEGNSLSVRIKRLQADITKVLSAIDLRDSDKQTRQILVALKHDLADVRLDIRDYEFAETRVEQGKLGQAARQRLASVKTNMLAASQYNIFSAIDIAQLSARLDQLHDALV